MIESVSSNVHDGCKWDFDVLVCRGNAGEPGRFVTISCETDTKMMKYLYLQPIKFFVVGKFEDKLIDYSVDSECPANQLQIGIFRVIENEIVSIEVCQGFAANSTGHLDPI